MSTKTLLQRHELGSWHLNKICLHVVHCTKCSVYCTFSLRGRTAFHPSEVGKIKTSLLRKVMERNGALPYPPKAAIVKKRALQLPSQKLTLLFHFINHCTRYRVQHRNKFDKDAKKSNPSHSYKLHAEHNNSPQSGK